MPIPGAPVVGVQAGGNLLLLRCSGGKPELVASVQGASISAQQSAGALGNRFTLLEGKVTKALTSHARDVCVTPMVCSSPLCPMAVHCPCRKAAMHFLLCVAKHFLPSALKDALFHPEVAMKGMFFVFMSPPAFCDCTACRRIVVTLKIAASSRPQITQLLAQTCRLPGAQCLCLNPASTLHAGLQVARPPPLWQGRMHCWWQVPQPLERLS